MQWLLKLIMIEHDSIEHESQRLNGKTVKHWFVIDSVQSRYSQSGYSN